MIDYTPNLKFECCDCHKTFEDQEQVILITTEIARQLSTKVITLDAPGWPDSTVVKFIRFHRNCFVKIAGENFDIFKYVEADMEKFNSTKQFDSTLLYPRTGRTKKVAR